MQQQLGGLMRRQENFRGCSVERDVAPRALARLIEHLQRLPGIGAKSAQRLAFHVLKTPRDEVERLADAMRDVKDRVGYCSVCGNITDADPCVYCTSTDRDQHVICVVEEPANVAAIEKTRHFRGVYHVLMGTLSPLQGVGPDNLKIKGLLARVGAGNVDEVVLATEPDGRGRSHGHLPGEAAQAARCPRHAPAMGVSVGSDLEYADEITMGRAMDGRREM